MQISVGRLNPADGDEAVRSVAEVLVPDSLFEEARHIDLSLLCASAWHALSSPVTVRLYPKGSGRTTITAWLGVVKQTEAR